MISDTPDFAIIDSWLFMIELYKARDKISNQYIFYQTYSSCQIRFMTGINCALL